MWHWCVSVLITKKTSDLCTVFTYFAFVCVCRYKNNGYVENTEKLVIHNDSGLETEVQFHFQYDTQASTYLLDPPSMTLQPDEKQVFVVLRFFRTSIMKLADAVNKMIFFFFSPTCRSWRYGRIQHEWDKWKTVCCAVSRTILTLWTLTSPVGEFGHRWSWKADFCTLTGFCCTGTVAFRFFSNYVRPF